MPQVPVPDPASVVMARPKVSESRRFCSSCEQPVGRARDGRPALDEGFCPHCRTWFSFLPKLKAGDLVDDRYELIGCLAYGGLGWIYLARDTNIGDEVAERWVVLKGLINTTDPDAMAAAVTERRFLVEVDHPNIVQIFDFVQHPDPDTGQPVSYIVMEYVGGRSLRHLLLERRGPTGRLGPMPLPQVLAYGLEVLPALGYLHGKGILFCDFKPDNVIHAEEQLKLIDLGAVRRIDDHVSAVYGTPGYQAPEVPQVGPSVAADLYTVGRTLAVLSFDFAGFSSRYADRLPARADVPVLAEHESYHRLLVRATHPDPGRRFESAAEMGEQLYGVLREVLSAGDGLARPAPSTLFTPERRAFGTGAGDLDGTAAGAMPVAVAVIAALPLPTVDPADPAAGYLATVGTTDPAGLAAALAAAPARSPEVRLRLVRGHVEAGDPAAARKELDALADDLPGDWRIDWYRGLAALAAADVSAARTSAFDAVYSALPGELAAQLALAVACEHAGDKVAASGYYQRVWRTDRSFVSAAFGLARHRFDGGDRSGAVAVLDQVPESSSYYLAAQVATVRVRLGAPPATLPEPDLLDAATRLERLELDVERQARLSVEMIHKALHWVLTRPPAGARQPPAAGRVLGLGLTERELRFGLERSYRALAKLSRDRQARAELVDLANAVRPRTLV
jgi:serine/threonine-protein kinase PknG